MDVGAEGKRGDWRETGSHSWLPCKQIPRSWSPWVPRAACPSSGCGESGTLAGMKVKVAQLCPTLCNPMDHTVCGILQARILEWVAGCSPLQRIFPTQALNQGLLHCRWILYQLSYWVYFSINCQLEEHPLPQLCKLHLDGVFESR